jgi:partner of Y14 and mago protein
MSSSRNGGGGGGGGEEEVKELAAELSKTLKEGERILAPSRRPDGTLRKPIRIRAGYVPQDEVAIYQSKGVLLRREMSSVPPGYDPVLDAKPKTKSAKRNERKKEKRIQQAANDKGKDWKSEVSSNEDLNEATESIESILPHMNTLNILTNSSTSLNSTESMNPEDLVPDIDKRIRAIKKKIRLTEAQQQQKTDMNPEQLEKLAKLEDWRKELKLLEDKKTEYASS